MPTIILKIRDKSLKITFNFAAQNAKPRIDADSEEQRLEMADGTGDGTGDIVSSCCSAGSLSAHTEKAGA